jgi:ABC-2 type transport system permease protein
MYTLFAKEVWRFMKVAVQTLFAPVLTVLLYLLVFASVLSERLEVYPNIDYSAFLIPGLIMMAMLQNAFSNSSSSLFQAKQNGNIVFALLAPLSGLEFFIAYVGASILRGLLVGLGVWLTALFFVDLPLRHGAYLLLFALLGNGLLGILGLIAAIVSDKWDHISAFQNFVILPLSFLSGVFYSIHNLPTFWPQVSAFNPFFYIIDGFRYGFLGVSDAPIGFSVMVVGVFFVAISGLCLWLLYTGYKLRN